MVRYIVRVSYPTISAGCNANIGYSYMSPVWHFQMPKNVLSNALFFSKLLQMLFHNVNFVSIS